MAIEAEDRVFPEGFLDPTLPRGYLSPSQFNMFRRCPKQWYFRYVLGLVAPPSISMLKGTLIHKGVEITHKRTIATGSPAPIDEVVQYLADDFEKRSEGIENWEETTSGAVKDDSIRGMRVYYRDAVPYITPVKSEHPFAIKVGEVPVYGVIDLVDRIIDTEMSLENDPENPNRVEVVSDLKTTSTTWTEQKLRQDPQMTFYALAEGTHRVRVDLLLDQKKGVSYKPMRTVRDAIDKRLLIEDVGEVVDQIKAGYFPRCDPTSYTCTLKFCGYYNRCRGRA